MKGTKIYRTALSQLNAYIKANNMRPTAERRMVLEQVCQLPQPFTAEQLIEVCSEQRISVGTVYNTLNLFISARILHAIERQRGKAATEYELIIGSQARMIVICERCGRQTELHDKAIDRLVRERRYSNFKMQHFSLFVYGECKICRRLINNE